MEEQLHRMGKEVAFYKSVMSPETDVKGLHVQSLGIMRGNEENAFVVNWVMTQVGKNDAAISGTADLRLIGDGIR